MLKSTRKFTNSISQNRNLRRRTRNYLWWTLQNVIDYFRKKLLTSGNNFRYKFTFFSVIISPLASWQILKSCKIHSVCVLSKIIIDFQLHVQTFVCPGNVESLYSLGKINENEKSQKRLDFWLYIALRSKINTIWSMLNPLLRISGRSKLVFYF